MNLPPARWLIGGVVPESGRRFVIAAPNAGKTWLALVIAKTAAALGRRVVAVLDEGSSVLSGWADVHRNLTHEQTPKGQVRVSWGRKAVECGEPPVTRIGAALRFHPEEVRRYLERLTRSTTNLARLQVRSASSGIDMKGV